MAAHDTDPPLSSLPRRAYRRYRTDGPSGVARRTVQYLSKKVVERRTCGAEDIAERDQRAEIWYTEPEAEHAIEPPDHPELAEQFAEYLNIHQPERSFACELPGCHLVDDQAVGLYEGRQMLLETTGDRISWVNDETYLRLLWHMLKSTVGLEPERAEQRLFVLVSPDPSYYHWLVEFLPKLRLLELYQRETEHRPPILIEHDPPDFVRESLALAGYADRWIEWDQTPRRVRRLVVPSHRPRQFIDRDPTQSRYQPSRDGIEWLRDRLRSRVSDDVDPERGRRIYVSRQRATRGRKVDNYEAALDVFREYGFESHALETLPFAEQVRLFVEADVIAGPHGAGLANMLFADDPLVVELFPETHRRPHFYFLASLLGFEHAAVVTDAVDTNLRVETDRLRRQLDDIGL